MAFHARFNGLICVFVLVTVGCTMAPAETIPSPAPSSAGILTAAAPSVDPFVANFLAANNATFQLQEPPRDVAISAVRAIDIVASQTQGPVKKADAVFGVLHANLGAIAPPQAWLVVLVGPGFVPRVGASPAPSPNLANASFAQAQNLYFVYAFVDASRGSMLMAGGSSPPP